MAHVERTYDRIIPNQSSCNLTHFTYILIKVYNNETFTKNHTDLRDLK